MDDATVDRILNFLEMSQYGFQARKALLDGELTNKIQATFNEVGIVVSDMMETSDYQTGERGFMLSVTPVEGAYPALVSGKTVDECWLSAVVFYTSGAWEVED